MTRKVQELIDRQIHRWTLEKRLRAGGAPSATPARPVITISRTIGSGGGEVGALVAERLNCQLYDRAILDEIAEKSEVRRELVESFDERARSRIEEWVEGLLRAQLFDEGDYLRRLAEVLNSLAEMRSVVIIGRGANFALEGRLRLDVRIIAPIEKRLRTVMGRDHVSMEEARRIIDQGDKERSKFIRRLYGKDWADSLAYDFTINMANLTPACAAAMIEHAWIQRMMASNPQTPLPAPAGPPAPSA